MHLHLLLMDTDRCAFGPSLARGAFAAASEDACGEVERLTGHWLSDIARSIALRGSINISAKTSMTSACLHSDQFFPGPLLATERERSTAKTCGVLKNGHPKSTTSCNACAQSCCKQRSPRDWCHTTASTTLSSGTAHPRPLNPTMASHRRNQTMAHNIINITNSPMNMPLATRLEGMFTWTTLVLIVAARIRWGFFPANAFYAGLRALHCCVDLWCKNAGTPLAVEYFILGVWQDAYDVALHC